MEPNGNNTKSGNFLILNLICIHFFFIEFLTEILVGCFQMKYLPAFYKSDAI
jgi:hypothetical protein